jgi:hypothetical protein
VQIAKPEATERGKDVELEVIPKSTGLMTRCAGSLTAVDREGNDSVWPAPRAAEVHARSSRDSPNVQKVERGAALSDMGPLSESRALRSTGFQSPPIGAALHLPSVAGDPSLHLTIMQP